MAWVRWILIGGVGVACQARAPARSQCDAVCDWAVACHAAERPVDAAALTAGCLEATEAASDSCDRANRGQSSLPEVELLRGCVSAIDARADAGECNAFTGSIDEIKTSAPPPACAGTGAAAVDVFEAAKDATAEGSAQLCQRLADTLCQTTATCILGDFGDEIPEDVTTAVGGTPFDLCVAQLDPVFTASCIAEDLYAPEQRIDEVNPARQSARECIGELPDTQCAALLGGDAQAFVDSLDPLCLGVATTPEDLLAMADVVVALADAFAQAAKTLP